MSIGGERAQPAGGVLIDARPTPMLHTCQEYDTPGQNELRCGSGRWAARSVDVRVDMAVLALGSIGMHAADGATAH